MIIPVFNTRDYLDACLTSVVNQTERDLEILTIDDGSTDGSLEKLDEWAARDSRIRVIRKERNSGVSASRNLGLEQARGTYVSFLDSDDWLEPEMLDQMRRCLDATGADVAFGGYNRIMSGETAHVKPGKPTGTVVDVEEALKHCMPQRMAGRYDMYICDKMFRRDRLTVDGRLCRFDTRYVYCEDVVWFVTVLLRCSRVVYWDSCGYNYRCEREDNAQSRLTGPKGLQYCDSALAANRQIRQMLRDAGSASLNNADQRILFYQKYALRAAAGQADRKRYRAYARGYIPGLLKWWSRNRTPIGLYWTLKQIASHAVFRITHLHV